MSTNTVAPVQHFEDAAEALTRVEAEADALDASNLSVVNLDLATAAAIALDVAPGLRAYRARLAALPEYDIRCVMTTGTRDRSAGRFRGTGVFMRSGLRAERLD